MLPFLPEKLNSEKLLFPTFRDTFFAEKNLLILINPSLPVINNLIMSVYSKNRLISPVNIVGTSTL